MVSCNTVLVCLEAGLYSVHDPELGGKVLKITTGKCKEIIIIKVKLDQFYF